jgi:hypothetical protein
VSAQVLVWLADGPPRNTGPDFGKASPFGLLIVVLLLICTGFLVWSMNRHLKKLPDRFDRANAELDQAVDDGTVGPDDASNDEAGNDKGSPPHEPGG